MSSGPWRTSPSIRRAHLRRAHRRKHRPCTQCMTPRVVCVRCLKMFCPACTVCCAPRTPSVTAKFPKPPKPRYELPPALAPHAEKIATLQPHAVKPYAAAWALYFPALRFERAAEVIAAVKAAGLTPGPYGAGRLNTYPPKWYVQVVP